MKINILQSSQSPDLNHIDHLWKELCSCIRTQNYSNQYNLFKTLQNEWVKIPQDRVMKFIESMFKKCEAVLLTKGYATKY